MMRAPPPHIDFAEYFAEVRQHLEKLVSFRITNWDDWPPHVQEFLKMCVIKAFPEDIRELAARCIYLPVYDFSGRGDWYYAVKHADEGEPAELRALLLTADVEMTDEGRALLSDFVWRYEIKGRFNRSWDMKARARLARAEWKKRRARPATPIYERSAVDAKIDCALAELRAWRRVFGRARVPVEHMAKLWGISASTLQNALEGRRGSERRKAARRKGKLPRCG
jgi:hypothetical protein